MDDDDANSTKFNSFSCLFLFVFGLCFAVRVTTAAAAAAAAAVTRVEFSRTNESRAEQSRAIDFWVFCCATDNLQAAGRKEKEKEKE